MARKNIKLLALNLHDTATLSASSEVLPVENTQRSERPMIWRSAGNGPQIITADFAAAAVVDCIAIARHSLSAGGVWRVELLNGQDVVYDSTDQPVAMVIPAGVWRAGVDPWGATYNDQLPSNVALSAHWLDHGYLATGYRITITPAATDAYVDIGRIFAGSSFSPSQNFDWNPSIGWMESAEHLMTEGGSMRTVGINGLRRKTSINLSWMNESDRTQLIGLLGKAGLGADLLVSIYPESDSAMLELEGMMVCRRDGALAVTHSMANTWRMPLTFLEI